MKGRDLREVTVKQHSKYRSEDRFSALPVLEKTTFCREAAKQ